MRKIWAVPADAGAIVGNISIAATMRPIEVEKVVNGEVKSAVLPATRRAAEVGTVPGPDVIVGDIIGVEQAVIGDRQRLCRPRGGNDFL